MDIHLSQELIIALVVGSVGLAAATITLLTLNVRHLGSMAKALRGHAEVNVQLNDELAAHIRERREERAAWDGERRTLAEQVNALRSDYTKTCEVYGQEIASLKATVKTLRQQNEQLQQRVHLLETDNVRLKTENAQKDEALLEAQAERDTWKEHAHGLEQRVDELERKVKQLEERGQQQVSDALALVRGDASPEAGEGAGTSAGQAAKESE